MTPTCTPLSREGTPAFALKEVITRDEKIERLNRLMIFSAAYQGRNSPPA
jgi:tRNA A37 methylthiotransferase MiaB